MPGAPRAGQAKAEYSAVAVEAAEAEWPEQPEEAESTRSGAPLRPPPSLASSLAAHLALTIACVVAIVALTALVTATLVLAYAPPSPPTSASPGTSAAPPTVDALAPSAAEEPAAAVVAPSPRVSPASPSPVSAYGAFDVLPIEPGRTLVVAIHFDSDTQHRANLRYFIRKAVRCWQDADYVFIIQHNDARGLQERGETAWRGELPALPPNARYVLHQNECFDWGTFGWLIRLPPTHADAVNASAYRYFITLNTSIRGPFLPQFLEDAMDPTNEYCRPPAQAPSANSSTSFSTNSTDLSSNSTTLNINSSTLSSNSSTLSFNSSTLPASASSSSPAFPPAPARYFSWFHVFLNKLSASTKLVGTTINCTPMAHVQSMLLAMDYVALQVLLQANGRSDKPQQIVLTSSYPLWQQWGLTPILTQATLGVIYRCHIDKIMAIEDAEIGASQALLKAGYNIACMMRVYAGVDFRREPQMCEAVPMHDKSPDTDAAWHGVMVERMQPTPARVPLEPSEVVFAKYKGEQTFPHTPKMNALLAWERQYRDDEWGSTHPDFTPPIITVNELDLSHFNQSK